MHYRGFVFLESRGTAELATAMAPFREEYNAKTEETVGHWDWYRPGGRYDGYLVSDDEMRFRETDNGFNFDDKNSSVAGNSALARDVPPDRRDVYFFLCDGQWVERQTWDGTTFNDVPDFDARLAAAFDTHPNHWVVVVDTHS